MTDKLKIETRDSGENPLTTSRCALDLHKRRCGCNVNETIVEWLTFVAKLTSTWFVVGPRILFISSFSTTWRSLVCESVARLWEEEKLLRVKRDFALCKPFVVVWIFLVRSLIYESHSDVTWNVINYGSAHTSNEASSGNNKHINLRLSTDNFILFSIFHFRSLRIYSCVKFFLRDDNDDKWQIRFKALVKWTTQYWFRLRAPRETDENLRNSISIRDESRE